VPIQFEYGPTDDDDDIIVSGRNNEGVTFKVIGTEERSALGGVTLNILTKDEAPIDTDYLIVVYLPVIRQIHAQGSMERFLSGVVWAIDEMEGLEDDGLTEI